jgi:formate hydrogenlyase subunit 6/NADH:ubiquinone oxidoreductase subunit I
MVASRSWLERVVSWAIVAGYRVLAPRDRNGTVLYGEIASAREMATPTPVPLLPLKELFLAGMTPGGGSLVRMGTRVLILGARPCDAAALAVMESGLAAGQPGAPGCVRRRDSLVVSFACTRPDGQCFCTSVGGAPDAGIGSDILVRRRGGDALRLEPQTPRGTELLQAVGGHQGRATAREAPGPATRPQARFELGAARRRLASPAGDALLESAARRCRGCGVCRSLCPTCHCAEPGDGTQWCCAGEDGGHACCATSPFPQDRGEGPGQRAPARWREWVRHKFVRFPTRVGRVGCVGCGRCVRACGVGASLLRLLRRAGESATEVS